MTRVITLLYHDLFERHPMESGFQGRLADRYKVPSGDFVRHMMAILKQRSDKPVLVSGCQHLPDGSVPFAITVDDGGVSYFTLLADKLESLGWRGHCLVTTGQLGRRGFMNEQQVRDLDERGHVIGSHTVSHPHRMDHCPWDTLIKEWRDSKRHLEDIVGHEVIIGSVPGGYYSARVARAAAEAGLKVLFTSEPQTGIKTVNGCSVVGRFAIRAGKPPSFVGRLVSESPGVRCGEWLAWNGKKCLKASLGPGYAWLGERMSATHRLKKEVL